MATTPEFSPARTQPAWRQKLSAFWRWWTHEIAQLVPERLALLRGSAHVPVVSMVDDELILIEPLTGALGLEGRIAWGALDPERRRAALRKLLERAGETRGRLRLRLGRDEALVRRVRLPSATEENLAQVLSFEMDRFTPFRAEEVYFDYRVVSRDVAAGQIVVQLAVARREWVDERVERLRSAGASVQGVAVADDAGHSSHPLDLLPSEQRGEHEPARERLIQRALTVAVVLLLLAALVVPIWNKRSTAIALNPIVTKARQQAEAADAIARELEKQAGDYNFLLAKKYASYPVLAVIEELSRLLPDNTWAQQIDIKSAGKVREVQITGETTSSSKLIEILEQSAVLQNASPRGTVTRGSQPGSERFMIAAEVKPRPLPEAQLVTNMVSVAPSAPASPVPKPGAAPSAPAAKAPAAKPAAAAPK